MTVCRADRGRTTSVSGGRLRGSPFILMSDTGVNMLSLSSKIARLSLPQGVFRIEKKILMTPRHIIHFQTILIISTMLATHPLATSGELTLGNCFVMLYCFLKKSDELSSWRWA